MIGRSSIAFKRLNRSCLSTSFQREPPDFPSQQHDKKCQDFYGYTAYITGISGRSPDRGTSWKSDSSCMEAVVAPEKDDIPTRGASC